MCGTDKCILIMALVVALGACTRSNPAPPSYRMSMKEAKRSPRGSWIRLDLRSKDVVSGELIAVVDGMIYVDTMSGFTPVQATDVTKAVLSVYEAGVAPIAVTWVLGELSTLSHGVFLIFTAPIWFISSAVALRVQSAAGYEDIDPSSHLDELRPYARFPQGLPPVLKTRRGSEGGLCFGNSTCARKLRCDTRRDVCVPDPTMGTPGGACYPDGSCDPGSQCDAQTARCAAAPPEPPANDAEDANAGGADTDAPDPDADKDPAPGAGPGASPL